MAVLTTIQRAPVRKARRGSFLLFSSAIAIGATTFGSDAKASTMDGDGIGQYSQPRPYFAGQLEGSIDAAMHASTAHARGTNPSRADSANAMPSGASNSGATPHLTNALAQSPTRDTSLDAAAMAAIGAEQFTVGQPGDATAAPEPRSTAPVAAMLGRPVAAVAHLSGHGELIVTASSAQRQSPPESMMSAPSQQSHAVQQDSTQASDRGAGAQATGQAIVPDENSIQFRADTLVVTPVLNSALITSDRTIVAGETAEFLAYSNYPAFINKLELRIFAAGRAPDSTPLATVDFNANSLAVWHVPTDGPTALYFVLRAYGANGKFDETAAQELTIVRHQVPVDHAAHPAHQVFGQVDQAALRTIELPGIMATVTGRANPSSDSVRVSGQIVPVDEDGQFAAQQIVPRSQAGMRVVIERSGTVVRDVHQDFSVPNQRWFVVGQGDLTIGQSYGTGPAVIASGDPTADGSYAIGRAAFYARGAVGDQTRVTASLDTTEGLLSDIFSNLDRKNPRQLLRRIDQNQYYPTYGDDSTTVEDAPTQGRFYLRAERGDSQFIVGNFTTRVNNAELAQLDRGLFGALLDVNSSAITEHGERRFQLTAFASDPGTVPGREELRGTGGSLYYLSRQDISVGSERVRVEVRDITTGIVLETRELYPQQDYDFDPFQGRITLLRPLASTVNTGATVRDGATTGNIPVLVVRYEYTPAVGNISGYTIGGRASGWVGEHLRFGVTAQRDTVQAADQNLLGFDALARITAGTYIKGEVAQTTGLGFSQSNSVNGGLSFTDIANPGTSTTTRAWRTEFAVNFAELARTEGDLGRLGGYYEHYDRGFSSAGRLTQSDTERWGVSAAIPFNQTGGVTARFDQINTADLGSSATGVLDIKQQWGIFGTSLGLRYEDRTPGLQFNSQQDGSRLDAAAQFELRPTGTNLRAYAFGQATLARDAGRTRNNRGGVGVNYELSDHLTVAGEVSGGSGGFGADIQANRRFGDGSEIYLGYRQSPDRTDLGSDVQDIFTRSDRGTLTVGARQRFSSALSVYGETRSGIGGRAPSLTRSLGLNFSPTHQLSFTGSLENGRIDDPATGPFRRFAATLGAGYSDDGFRIGSNAEVRSEHGPAVNQTAWLFRNDLNYQLNPNWRAIGQFNFAFANANSASIRAAEYIEAVGGIAYRPVNNERLNGLFRVMYYRDLGPVGQVTGSGLTQSPKQSSTIASIDVSYDLSERLTVGAKYGYRAGRVSLGRDSDQFVSSEAHLGVVRLDYRVLSAWDVLAEGRILNVASSGTRLGALAAVYRHIGGNVKVGVGYSWSDFSDDLTDQSYSSHGPFLNLVTTF